MASYTDIIPQFNPYVSQLPVEAMVKVGMEKQKRYDEGVQKIQGFIDNVAGLDITDKHRNYLQSKLNELGNDLTRFAASDFSNYQLVNSVAGMTKQLVKDPTIQTGVSAARRIREGQELMDADEKSGKSNPNNSRYWKEQISDWMDDGDLNASFNGSYYKPRNVFAKLGDIAKSVGEDSTIVQMLFQTDGRGNPILVNGKLQYNDVMAETLLKGKDKNKILNAFMTGLDAGDYKQLAIDGMYNLEGKDRAALVGMLDDSLNEYEMQVYNQQEEINDNILKLKNKGGSQEDIDALEQKLVTLDENLRKRRESVDKTINTTGDKELRSMLYTNNYLDSMSSAFSTKETYTKYLENPAVKMMMERERLAISKAAEQRARDEFDYKKIHDKEVMDQERWKALFEKGLVDEEGNPTGASLYGGTARDVTMLDKEGSYFTNQFEQGLQKDMDVQFSLYEKVAVAHWMASNSKNGKNLSEAEIKKSLEYYAGKNKMSYNDYVVLQGEKAFSNFYSKNSIIGNEFADDFAAIKNLRRTIGTKSAQMAEKKQYITDHAEGFTPVDLTKIDIKPITVTAVLGGEAEGKGRIRRENVTLSKQDVLDFASFIYHDWEGGFVPGALDSDIVKNEARKAKERLIKKYGTAGFESIQKSIRGEEKFDPADINPFHLLLGHTPGGYEQNPQIKKAINVISSANYFKTRALEEQYFRNISEAASPKQIPLYKDKEGEAKHLATSISAIATDYANIDDDYAKFSVGAEDPKSQFFVRIDPATDVYGKNTYTLQMTADGELLEKPITESQFKNLTGIRTPQVYYDPIGSAIKSFSTKTGSTNSTYSYTDPSNAQSTAYFKDDDFPSTNNYNVAMDFALGSNGRYYPKMYVQTDENNWRLIQYGLNKKGFKGYTKQEAATLPSIIDDTFIKQLLTNK